MPTTGFAHESADPLHPISVETIGTSLAYPTQVHVQQTDQGLEIKGKLKRKRHNNQSLRGHMDVDLIGTAGKVLESVKVLISPRRGSLKHDHESEKFSVRISHILGGHNH